MRPATRRGGARRRSRTADRARGVDCGAQVSADSSSLAARSMSVWYLSRMCSVSRACAASIDSTPSTTRVRAQSRVSETDGRLAQLEGAQGADDPGDLVGQLLADPRNPGQHDVALALEVGVVDVQVQAPPLERLGQLPGVVRGEEHQRHRVAATVPSSGIDTWYSERTSSKSASVSSSTRSTSSISSTTGSSARMASRSGRVSRNSSEKMSSSSSSQVGDRCRRRRVGFPDCGLDTQQLLAVVPLVEGLGLVEPLVALEPNEPAAGQVGHRLGQLRLAGTGRPFLALAPSRREVRSRTGERSRQTHRGTGNHACRLWRRFDQGRSGDPDTSAGDRVRDRNFGPNRDHEVCRPAAPL